MPYVKDTGEHDRNRRIAWFVFWNLLSFAAMAGMFWAVRDLDVLQAPFEAAFRFFFTHEIVAVLAAISPFAASLLVGYGYAKRARQRKERQADLAFQGATRGYE
jgi:membrane associated rhomboid family serine protease